MEDHRDLVSTLIKGIIGVIIWLIGVINLLTKSPWPSKYSFHNYHLWNFEDTRGFDLEVKLETPNPLHSRSATGQTRDAKKS